MTRINLTDNNNTDYDRPLNFNQTGSLTVPINAKNVSLIRFSIPPGSIPLFLMNTDYEHRPYSFTLTYQTESSTAHMILEDRGYSNRVYDVDHICSMMNDALRRAFAQLKLQISFSETVPPYVIYDNINSLFSVITHKTSFATTLPDPIYITVNRNMWRFLQGISSIYSPNGDSRLIIESGYFDQNLYSLNTDYIKTTQECPSTSNWALIRIIYINTNLPIESEIFTSPSINTGQTSSNIISSYIIPMDNGTLDYRTSLNFSAPDDHFRPCKLMGNNIYDIKCDVRYQDVEGNDQYFFIGARSIANIELEFFD